MHNTQLPIPAMPKATFIESAIFPEVFVMFTGLRKQATFCNAPTLVFPLNVMKRCYLDLCGASNWSAVLLQPIQSTTSYFISVDTPLKIALYYCRAVPVSVNKFNTLFSYNPSCKSTQFNPIQFIVEHLFQKAGQMPIMFYSYLWVWDIRRDGYFSLQLLELGCSRFEGAQQGQI